MFNKSLFHVSSRDHYGITYLTIIQNQILIQNKFSWKNNRLDWTESQFHSIESRIMSKTSMNGLLATINCFIRKETRVALYFPQNWTRNHVIDSDNLIYNDLYFYCNRVLMSFIVHDQKILIIALPIKVY